MRSPKKTSALLLALASISALPTSYADEASKNIALPGAIHLDGVGTLYGAVAGIKDIGSQDYDVYVGVAGGDAKAFGLAITDIGFLGGKFSYIYAQGKDATIDTQYQRGGDAGRTYEKDTSGSIHHFTLKHQLPLEHLTSELSLSRSSVTFDGFATEDGDDIFISESGLHDIDTTSISAGLTWDNRRGPVGLAEGSKISGSIKFDTGRTGQSDQGQFSYQLSHHISIGNTALASFYLNGSHAFIVSEATKYDSSEEVRDALGANCNQLSDANQQANCLALENDLVSYVVESNKKGTANAVGGSKGLRSYQESFLRGSNSLVEGVEVQWQLPEYLQLSNSAKLQWIGFAEGAQVADSFGDLSDNSNYSIGTGLRAYVNEIPVRLEFAHGNDGNAFLLTGGLVF